jgi:hypothetical protein
MLKKIALAVLGVVLIFLGVVALQPNEYAVTRTIEIAAPPPEVHALINDFHKWENWSPWAKLDPNMKTDYSGAPAGPTASYHWIGNDKVGEGRMTITDSQPPQSVKIDLEFITPFPSKSITLFTVSPAGAGSKVEWRMSGENSFIPKGMMLLMGGMDKAVGPDFEKGLAQMKALAEKH